MEICTTYYRQILENVDKSLFARPPEEEKWLNKSNNIQKWDIVLVVNETTHRNLWPLGIVVDVNQGRDNLVRSVRLKTKSGEIVTPVPKLVQLEANLF